MLLLGNLSELGGLMQITFMVLTFLYGFYYRHKIYEYLMNKVFNFDIR